MSEPSSTLTFGDLILEVAEKLGIAYYGEDGNDLAAIPTNAHDLALCQRIVNNAIRMFIHDGPPPNGWRWLRPVGEVVLWGDIAANAGNPLVSAVEDGGQTTLTVADNSFYPSMELKEIAVTDVGTFTITDYVSPTSVIVSGDASAGVGKTWSIASNGNYTLPRMFGGQHLGGLTYTAGTNRGIGVEWVDESVIRSWRADVQDEYGDPYLFAIRVMDTGTPRRRWELLTYPKTDEVMTVEFPYMLHFDALTSNTEVHPAPFAHDETIKAACRAQAEKEVERALGVEWSYYRDVALPNSFRIDAMSAPKRLGYFWNPGTHSGNPMRTFREQLYNRPTVQVNV